MRSNFPATVPVDRPKKTACRASCRTAAGRPFRSFYGVRAIAATSASADCHSGAASLAGSARTHHLNRFQAALASRVNSPKGCRRSALCGTPAAKPEALGEPQLSEASFLFQSISFCGYSASVADFIEATAIL
jgi:hypothetical protein